MGIFELSGVANRNLPQVRNLREVSKCNPVTTIRYGLPEPGLVTLIVYNLLGKEIAILVDKEQKQAGFYTAVWNGRDSAGQKVSSGVYFARMRAGDFVQTRKMVLIE
jgi:hypothetical protein